jgi:isopentenyl-diphosphate delta-isomerase
MDQIESRKDEHVRIALEENVEASYNYWDDVVLTHNALPEINKEEISLDTSLFDKPLKAPIIISGMTGGYRMAEKINERLGQAAENFQIGMGVGSQRAALENPSLKQTYSIIKDMDIPVKIANIGASQLVIWGHERTVEEVQKMIDMIDADAVAVCLNFLQEVVQFEGEAEAKGCLEEIKKLSKALEVPVMVKESGAGISYDVAKRLAKTNIAAIDVGGMGGTSFAAIEHFRAKMHFDQLHARGGRTFWNWGIPTPKSIIDAGEASDWKIPIIATGGIRNGLDAAKALALGARCAGVAHVLLAPALKSKQETIFELDAMIKELRAAMFLTGKDSVEKFSEVESTVWM